ncbi:MAG: Intracellular distribution of mitochondria [Piccolia ochrophora]|nr:MAG: Intracellular distribution of mitochondria [Piccolia ochrophora]
MDVQSSSHQSLLILTWATSMRKLTLSEQNFRGQHGKAYLFGSVVNIISAEAVERNMTTGRHVVRDICCRHCKDTVGWKYDKAYESSEKYKEGKYILEAELLYGLMVNAATPNQSDVGNVNIPCPQLESLWRSSPVASGGRHEEQRDLRFLPIGKPRTVPGVRSVRGVEASAPAANGITHDEPPLTTELAEHGTSGKGKEETTEGVFQLTVNLPHEPHRVQIMVSSQEQVQDIRQSVVELPETFQYTCFHLEHQGQRVNDFVELSEVKDLTPNSELTLVEDPYTEKDARLHLLRIRELIGAVGDRTDTLLGVEAGLCLHDTIVSRQQDGVASNVNGASGTAGSPTPSHPLEGYDFESPGSLSSLLPPTRSQQPKALKSISVSPWHPPPYHLRQKGHLLYIQLTTNEGEQYQITSCTSGFFVNKCSNSKFDPFPKQATKPLTSHSLMTLLTSISPSFSKSLVSLQEYNSQKDPLAVFQLTNAIPMSPWAVQAPNSLQTTHQADAVRAQESFLIAGMDNSDTLRDWNEEFQSTRELPKDGVQERVFRERLTSKLSADYNDAAARGAVLVARGEVPALNPTEERDAQIFVYNNVFFSFGADGVDTFAAVGGDEAARVAVGKDVSGVRAVNQLDVEGIFTPATVVVDFLGKRIVGQSIVPGIFKQREPGEHQIDYGGVEGKGVVTANEAFVPVFNKLSQEMRVSKHPVWDKDGTRHDLEASVETKGLLGTDGRKYVLDLYRITPLDVHWVEKYWSRSSELDSAEERTAGDDGKACYPHRMTVLRPELVESYWKLKAREFVSTELDKRKVGSSLANGVNGHAEEPAQSNGVKSPGDSVQSDLAEPQEPKEDNKEPEQERIDVSNFRFSLNPDVFSGQEPQTKEEKAELSRDEGEVRAACDFLTSKILPELIHDLNEGDVGLPMDGQSLSRLLHKRGINVRYLGTISQLAKSKGSRLESLRQVAVQEMVSRAFKHVARRYLRYLPVPLAASCVAHLLNCLLGSHVNADPMAQVDDTLRNLYPESDFAFTNATPETIRVEVEDEISLRFRYDLQESWIGKIKHVQLLREIAVKLGLQLEAKDYRFIRGSGRESSPGESPTVNGDQSMTNGHPSTAGKKKRKADRARNQSPLTSESLSAEVTFQTDDIVNFVPVVKESAPRSTLAEEALEAGRLSIAQNQKELGQELLLESLSLHEQIYGILHPEVARFYSQLAMIYYHLEEKNAAVELAHKAVIVSERTIGVDSAETILGYLNLALFEHASANTQGALAYLRHALDLWKVVYGTNHPDSITTLNNAAVMLQSMRMYKESRTWFEASLRLSETTFGKQTTHTATLLFQLAQALALDQDSKGAVNCMREAYSIFLSQLGADDKNTKEAENWLEQLTQNAVSIAKHTKDLQSRRLRRINLTPRMALGTRPQPQAGQSSSEAANADDPTGRREFDSRSLDELMKFIEGGGDASRMGTPKKRPGRSHPKRRGGKPIPS